LKSPCPDSETLIAQLAPHVTRIDVDDVRVIRFPWDLMSGLGEAITADAAQYPLGVIRGQLYSFSVLYNEPNILIGDRSVVEDFVVLDARSGPIVIESDVVIESHSRIDGPAYIGPYSRILGGRIRGSSIGPHCKIAGEMSQCVVAGYSNKGHDGFWGNSYIGYWVNIGANSVTSNLKNTYGSISLNYFGATIDTGQQFLGALVGDHVKLGIGSHLATGSMVGMGSSVYGTSLHSKYIPPFTWGDSGDYRIVDIDPMIVAAARMKARRGQVLGSSEETLLRQWHGERGGV
jgi:UDP-N-acetylglucosamine diphosphorylase/glucosamine-1-phosphate N-acetyltransferase